MVFGSKAAKEKLQGTGIQGRFGDSEICLSFRKRTGPLRNGRELIFVTILLPEFISDQAVRLALFNFGYVVSVFKGRHKFNGSIRNGKRHGRIFPARGDPEILPRKISFHVNIQWDVLFAEKVVLCYRCKTCHMFGENYPVITPTQKDSSMSFTEQSASPSRNPSPRQLDHSIEIVPCVESLQKPSAPTKDVVRGDCSGDISDSDSDSESGSRSCSDSNSHNESNSESEHSSEKLPSQPSKETSSEIPKDQTNLGRLLHRSQIQMYIRNVPTQQQRNVP